MDTIGAVLILVAISLIGGFVGTTTTQNEMVRMCDNAGIYVTGNKIITCSVKDISKK